MTKSRFWTFIFSLVPGAGQMYQGFMKKGISIMFSFFFVIFVADFFRISMIFAILPVLWCYGFFDTMNKGRLTQEELSSIEDKSIFGSYLKEGFSVFEKKYVWLGFALIAFGGLLLLDNVLLPELERLNLVNYYHAREILRTFIAAGALIGLGVKLISGKREKI